VYFRSLAWWLKNWQDMFTWNYEGLEMGLFYFKEMFTGVRVKKKIRTLPYTVYFYGPTE
jgi:hypothetical protein